MDLYFVFIFGSIVSLKPKAAFNRSPRRHHWRNDYPDISRDMYSDTLAWNIEGKENKEGFSEETTMGDALGLIETKVWWLVSKRLMRCAKRRM